MLTIGKLARAGDLSPDALRYYELATQSVGIASGISLLAGLFFSLTPLAIAALPVPLAYVTRARAPREAVRYGLAFISGLIAAHTLPMTLFPCSSTIGW